ncbi:WD40-repeat-containing domain protein, partial [Vararia minispora EC-137]
STRWKRNVLAHTYSSNFERIGILGSDTTGHTGCVNALSWAHDGNLLLSGGDDTTVRIWRMKSSGSQELFPFTCQSVIETGHTANIFNAHMLPYSTRIATVAGDHEVRVFDATTAVSISGDGSETRHNASTCKARILRCHTRRTKRIVTEESPDLFLTVAEDGTVRQHDLRTLHSCRSGCPAPLVKLASDLSTLSLSPLTPYQFVVAGESPYGFLFDRRHAGRFIEEEWGVPISDDSITCVRMFGRPQRSPGERRGYEHVTGSRMSSTNGHEVLHAYSSDAVYLYSTRDDAEVVSAASEPGILTPNAKFERKINRASPPSSRDWVADPGDFLPGGFTADEDEEEEGEGGGDDNDVLMPDGHDNVPVVLPRRRFTGHCNIETIKDVNFLGPTDEFVVSGSDDGNWFMWHKSTGALCGIYHGDDSVVNVIESHPYLPLVAVSGIDTTVKLFAPVQYKSKASRMRNAETILSRNVRSASTQRVNLYDLFMQYQMAMRRPGQGDNDED